MRIFNFHKHEWSKWHEPRLHMWKHYSEMLRFCQCGQVERKVFDLFCPTYKRTEKFCFFCSLHVETWQETLAKTEYLCNNDDMEKLKRGRPRKTQRNEEIKKLIKEGFSYGQVAKKFGLVKSTVFVIANRKD